MAAKRRFDALQTLRFICFMAVFFEHSGYYKLTGQMIFFELSLMSIFLMMSGFLMYYSYGQKEISAYPIEAIKFSIQKISKLYPLHLETTLLQLAFFVYFYFDNFVNHPEWMPGFVFRVLVNLGLLQAWFPNRINYTFFLNGPSWFLSVMLFAYFAFPYILKLIKKLGTIKKNIMFALIVYIISFLAIFLVGAKSSYGDIYSISENDVFLWFSMNSPIIRVTDFYLGCVIGFIYCERRKTEDIDGREYSVKRWTLYEILSFLFFRFVSLFIIAGLYVLGPVGKCFIFCPMGIPCILGFPLLMCCIYSRGKLTKIFSWKPLVYLGDISMYTYLIHYIFTQLWAYLQDYVFYIDRMDSINYIAVFVELLLTIFASVLYDKHRKNKVAKAKIRKA